MAQESDPIQGYSPAGQLLHLITGYWVSQAIYVAAELGVADRLGKKPCMVDALAAELKCDTAALYRVLRALASVGIFAEVEPRAFVQTPMGVLLRQDMPGNLAAFSRFQGDAWHWDAWGSIVESVRSGKSGMALRHGVPHCFDYFAKRAPSSAMSATFDAAMAGYAAQVNAAVVDAYDFSGARCIVDVGGGQGALLCAMLECAPHARGVLADRAEVLAHAEAALREQGLVNRISLILLNFFESAPTGGDVYVLSSVLHDWEDGDALTILRNVRAAMDSGASNARLLIIEHVLPDNNEAHPGKFIDLEMMLVTGGKERTLREYQTLLAEAGFAAPRLIATATSASIIEARSKAA